MLNWYIFKTAKNNSLGYGSWISPEGEVIIVKNFEEHAEVARIYLEDHLEIFANYLKIIGEEVPKYKSYLMELLYELHSY